MRLLEQLAISNQGLEHNEKLLKRIEKHLKSSEVFSTLNKAQMIKLTRIFSTASNINVVRYPILDKLVKTLNN
jgi:uncharacterized Fe-S center protein